MNHTPHSAHQASRIYDDELSPTQVYRSDEKDALESGVEALSGEPTLVASEVLAYLHAHPEFFNEHSDVLAKLPLPTQKDGNVISLANWQTQLLRDKADEHKARLEQLLIQATRNQVSHDKLLSLVTQWLSVVSADELPSIVARDLKERFGLDAVEIMVWDEHARVNFYPKSSPWADSMVVFSNSLYAPYCGPCKGFEIEKSLAQQSASGSVASLAIIPLWGKRSHQNNSTASVMQRFECIGVLIFGSEDAHRFSVDMGTQFLQHIGAMVGSALSRLTQAVEHS